MPQLEKALELLADRAESLPTDLLVERLEAQLGEERPISGQAAAGAATGLDDVSTVRPAAWWRGPVIAVGTAAAIVALVAMAAMVLLGDEAVVVDDSADEPLPVTTMQLVIEAPHVVIEGGEDILATTSARATPPVATCPAGTDPDRPGPVDQARPNQISHMVMDRQSGRIVATGDSGGAMGMWAFDVCTNTWALQDATRSVVNAPDLFVYDADSDIVVAIGRFVDTYDVDTDAWERLGEVPSDFDGEGRAVYDPVSGLVVVRDIDSSKMWAYDVDTDTWTPIRQGPISPPTAYPSFGHVHAYDATADRIVLYLSDSGARAPITWTYDLRAGEWTVEDTLTPDLTVGAYAQPSGKAAYDEAAQLTVITSADGEVVGYDAARHEWQLLSADSGEPDRYDIGVGSRFDDKVVYDPVNDRIVVMGGTARLLNTEDDATWMFMNDVWAFDTDTGTWSQLLAATTG